MNPNPESLDLRMLRLPTAELEEVTHALADAASGTTYTNNNSTSIPANISPSSTQSVSARLALLIRHALHPSTVSPNTPPITPFVEDVFTKPTPSILTREMALVHALAIWSDSILSQSAVRAIYRPLAEQVISTLHEYVVQPHLNIPPSSLRLWQDVDHARRHVFQKALATRYDNIDAAPTAAMMAGAPLVLYIYQNMHIGERQPESPVCAAWERVVRGTALFQRQAVSSVDTVRTTVASALKNAVKERSLSPALVVVDATLNDTFCAAAAVLRALCDSYGVCLHVEGDALALLLAGDTTNRLTYDVADFVRSAHSVVLDVARWFGRHRTAVLSVSIAESTAFAATSLEVDTTRNAQGDLIADFELSRVMALWFLLQRLHLPRCADIMRSLCDMSLVLTDALLSIPHLIECKTSGCGANVLISYASMHADATSRAAVNRAILTYFERKHEAMRNLLVMANHENREWLLFSPARIVRAGIERPCRIQDVMLICSDIIYAARRCELVVKGQAAFRSRIRQSPDLEVGNLPLQDAPYSPLFFSALRVTPFGEVSLNGHWVKDQEMTERVEKFTYALASLFEAQSFELFEGILYDSDSTTAVPVVCIGPLLQDVKSGNGVSEDVHVEAITESSENAGMALSMRSASLADEWDIDEMAAQDLALKAADKVLSVLDMALNSSPELPLDSTAQSGSDTGLQNEEANKTEDNVANAEPLELVEENVLPPHDSQPVKDLPTDTSDERIAFEKNCNQPGTHVEENGKDVLARPTEPLERVGSPARVREDRTESSGLWGLIFGERTTGQRNDDEDTASSTGSGIVEDDYFRV